MIPSFLRVTISKEKQHVCLKFVPLSIRQEYAQKSHPICLKHERQEGTYNISLKKRSKRSSLYWKTIRPFHCKIELSVCWFFIRDYAVVILERYANARKLIDINIPTALRSIPRTYIPHAFTVEEPQNFFRACDSIKAKYGLIGKIQKITVPVFFRLLYSSGIRTTEARLLRRKDVNLENGVVNIGYSKGYNHHFVVLHDTMLDLMKKYDVAISKIISDRTFFFPTRSNKGYPNSWVTRIFRICWYEGNKASAIAYELRHHYAVENINGWIGQGLTTHLKLLSLSKSMGHTNVESTKYYYSLVPGLSDIIEDATGDTFDQIMPNLQNDEESHL